MARTALEFAGEGEKPLDVIVSQLGPDDLALADEYAMTKIQAGCKNTRIARNLWVKRFEEFRVQHLQQNPDDCPGGLDIRRFIAAFCLKKAEVSEGKDVLRRSTINSAIALLRDHLSFTFPAFDFARHESLRLKATLQALERDGKITRALQIERKPVGALLIRQLVSIMMRDAIWHGTKSWTATITAVTTIVIIASLNARTGDVVESQNLDPMKEAPYMVYGDVELVVTGEGIDSIKGRWKMRNCKGEKLDPHRWFYIYRNALPDTVDNVICPVRLLLTLALRTGNVEYTTVEDVIREARLRPDKTVQWVCKERPVLCAIKRYGIGVEMEKQARYAQVRDILKNASVLARSIYLIRPHDIRHGAARDLVTVAPKLTSGATPIIADELGHSDISRAAGTTRRYSRAYTYNDSWAKRAQIRLEDQPFQEIRFEVESDARPPSPKRKRLLQQRIEAVEECLKMGTDPTVEKNRRIARYHLNREFGPVTPLVLNNQGFNGKGAFYPSLSEISEQENIPITDHTGGRAFVPSAALSTSSLLQADVEMKQPSADQENAPTTVVNYSVVEDHSNNELKTKTEEIDEECRRLGRDPEDLKERKRANVRLQKHKQKAEKNRRIQEQLASQYSKRAFEIAVGAAATTFQSHVEDHSHSAEDPSRSLNLRSLLRNKDFEGSNRDIEELLVAVMEDDDESLAQDHQTPGSVPPNDPSALTALITGEFIRHFSTINLFIHPIAVQESQIGSGQQPGPWIAAREEATNPLSSVGEPAQFRHFCPAQPKGCPYSTCNREHFERHREENCAFRNHVPGGTIKDRVYVRKASGILGKAQSEGSQQDGEVEPTKKERVKCKECEKDFASTENLSRHMKTEHNWPRLCPVSACNASIVFEKLEDLQTHWRKCHPSKAIIPTKSKHKCPFPGCTVRRSGNNEIRKHLREDHLMTEELVDDHCPARTAGSHGCFYPGCESTEYFIKKTYIEHLEQVHGLKEEWEQYEYTKKRALGEVPPMEH